MVLTAPQLAKHLAQARVVAGLSLEDAARKAHIEPVDLRDAEAGNTGLSAAQLMDLADAYGIDASDLILGRPAGAPAAKFRRAGGPGTDEDLVALLNRQYAGVCDLQGLVNRPAISTLDLRNRRPLPSNAGEARAAGADAAREARYRLGLPDGAIQDLPSLLQSLGIRVYEAPMTGRVSGVFLNRPDLPPVILVSRDEPDERKSFSVAHELGHAILDADEVAVVSRLESNSLEEVRANAFAAELLIPAAFLQSFAERHGKPIHDLDPFDVAKLSAAARTSYSAAAFHLYISGHVPRARYMEFQEFAKRASAYRNRAFGSTPLTANRIGLLGLGRTLAERAYQAEEISEARRDRYLALFALELSEEPK